ncbi:hypothetical protein ACAX43_12515 [Paraburkholderia sp. IW21]|uniref:hypothetical protein n=1 Tax=Paraburkholderia sp. IW21 TaxID=3242488 RepID=UPI00351FF530
MTYFFTVKDSLQVTFDGAGFDNVAALAETVSEWLASNNVRNYMETGLVKHYAQPSACKYMIGFEAPTYTFYNEDDALQFQLVFGAEFDHEELGEWQ